MTGCGKPPHCTCQNPPGICNGQDFVRLIAAVAERRCRSCFAPLSPGQADTKLFAASKAASGAQVLRAVVEGYLAMSRGAGSALLFARPDASAVTTRDTHPSPASGAGPFRITNPGRAANRRSSACRRPSRRASAFVGAVAARARTARSLLGGKPVARRSESRTWQTRCSSTPPIRRRRALS